MVYDSSARQVLGPLVLWSLTLGLAACPLTAPSSDPSCVDDEDCNVAAGYACNAERRCALPDAGRLPDEGEGERDDGGEPDAGDGGERDGGGEAPVCPSAATALELSCDASASSCALDVLDGDDSVGAGYASCLSCSAQLERVILHQHGFGDELECDLGGWHVLQTSCSDNFDAASCRATGGQKACCDDPARFCPLRGGERVIAADQGCAEETSLKKIFDLRGYTDARFCFSYGGVNTQAGDGLRVVVRDALTDVEVPLVCLPGEGLGNGEMTHTCAALPPSTNDSRYVELELVLHTESAERFVYLDDVRLDAVPLYPCGAPLLLAEDPMALGCVAGTNTPAEGWTPDEGTDVRCQAGWTCATTEEPVTTIRNEGALSRDIPLPHFVGGARLCFDVGHQGANGGDGYVLSVDTGGGLVEVDRVADVRALIHSAQVCAPRCVDLSHVAGLTPGGTVGIHFATFGDRQIGIRNLRLTGQGRCDAEEAGLLHVGSAVDDGAGGYHLPLDANAPVSVELRCSLDDNSSVSAEERVELSP